VMEATHRYTGGMKAIDAREKKTKLSSRSSMFQLSQRPLRGSDGSRTSKRLYGVSYDQNL